MREPPGQPSHAARSLAETLAHADLDRSSARSLGRGTLRGAFGVSGPTVEVHRALSLRGASDQPRMQQITAFLPGTAPTRSPRLLAAFDAIPEAWIDDYRPAGRDALRGSDDARHGRESYHSNHVAVDR